jgi:hypothetical protein
VPLMRVDRRLFFSILMFFTSLFFQTCTTQLTRLQLGLSAW